MEVLYTRLTGDPELWKGSVEAFMHFNHLGEAPLDCLALVDATEKEREVLEAAGYEFDYDCGACALVSYGQRPAPECLETGCIRRAQDPGPDCFGCPDNEGDV